MALQHETDEDTLLTAARAGDGPAFASLYRLHVDVAVRVAKNLGRRNDAEDVASEAFAKVLDLMKRGKGPERYFRAYLITAVRHECGVRKKQDLRTKPDSDDARIALGITPRTVNDLSPDLDGIAHEAIKQAYAVLEERWKQVLWMTAVDGAKPAEVAHHFGISPNSMSALTYRARNALRENYIRIRQDMEDQIAGIVRDEISDDDKDQTT